MSLFYDGSIHCMRSQLTEASTEIERLTERCAAYKGQVEAGAAEIERLKKANEELRKQLVDQN